MIENVNLYVIRPSTVWIFGPRGLRLTSLLDSMGRPFFFLFPRILQLFFFVEFRVSADRNTSSRSILATGTREKFPTFQVEKKTRHLLVFVWLEPCSSNSNNSRLILIAELAQQNTAISWVKTNTCTQTSFPQTIHLIKESMYF